MLRKPRLQSSLYIEPDWAADYGNIHVTKVGKDPA